MPRKINIKEKEVHDIHSEVRSKQFSKKTYAYLGIKIANILCHTNITPNQVTIIATIIGIIAAFFFIPGKHYLNVIGALLLQLSLVLDYSDGAIARKKKMVSNRGLWYDSNFDIFVDAIVLSFISIGTFYSTGLLWPLFAGIAITNLRFLIYNLGIFFELTMKGSKALKGSLNNKFLNQFIYTRENLFFALLIFSIANLMTVYIIALLCYSILFYISSFVYLTLKVK